MIIEKRFLRIISVFFILCSLLSVNSVGAQGPNADGLKDRYPWRSIYLTGSNISNLETILMNPRYLQYHTGNESVRFGCINPACLLHNFFKEYEQVDDISLVVIDLQQWRVGYVVGGIFNGLLNEYTIWTPEQIKSIALWVHDYLLHQDDYGKAYTRFIEGKDDIPDASNEIDTLQTSYFTTPEQNEQLGEAFRALIAKKPEEVDELKDTDPNLYNEIVEFVDIYDRLPEDTAIPWHPLEGLEYDEDFLNQMDQERFDDLNNQFEELADEFGNFLYSNTEWYSNYNTTHPNDSPLWSPGGGILTIPRTPRNYRLYDIYPTPEIDGMPDWTGPLDSNSPYRNLICLPLNH